MGDYIKFAQDESAFANQERMSYGKITEVSEMISLAESNDKKAEAQDYIESHINILFNYAPHLTLQLYLTILITQNKMYEVKTKLDALLTNPDLPAKAYSVVQSYINVLKDRENASVDLSFADDAHIKEYIDSLSQDDFSKLLMAIQTRLTTGTSPDYLVELLNPFLRSESIMLMYKLAIVQQFVMLVDKYPCTKAFTIGTDEGIREVMVNGKLDFKTDAFLKIMSYYVKSLNVSDGIRNLIINTSQMYRILHYNEEKVLNTEIDIKSFAAAVIDSYNESAKMFSPNDVVKYETPASYLEAYGYKEAKSFSSQLYRMVLK